MNRLHIISFINSSWYKQITEFLEVHPEFNKLIPIVALDEYPNGFNKNPIEQEYEGPRNVFEILLNGLAYAGSDIDYGKEQFLMIAKFFRGCDVFTENMELPKETQPEKVPIYKTLVNTLLEKEITMSELKYIPEHIEIIENIEGMTESTITLLHLLYDDVTSDRCLPFGDKQFKRGMSMFYGIENPLKIGLKKITDTWSNKKVGLMFIVQFAHYSEFV